MLLAVPQPRTARAGVALHASGRFRAGDTTHDGRFRASDTTHDGRFRCTTPARTLLDLATR
jgi:hypothetical protein